MLELSCGLGFVLTDAEIKKALREIEFRSETNKPLVKHFQVWWNSDSNNPYLQELRDAKNAQKVWSRCKQIFSRPSTTPVAKTSARATGVVEGLEGNSCSLNHSTTSLHTVADFTLYIHAL